MYLKKNVSYKHALSFTYTLAHVNQVIKTGRKKTLIYIRIVIYISLLQIQ